MTDDSRRVPLGPKSLNQTPYVTLLDGVAGAGKTSEMLMVLEELIDQGLLEPHKFRFVLFGRDAADSVAERVGYDGKQTIPDVAKVVKKSRKSDSEVDKPFRTFNSLALAAAKSAGAIPHEADIIVSNDACSCGASSADQCSCGGGDDDFADEYWFKHFFESHWPSVSFDARERDPLQMAADKNSGEVPVGNKLMALYQYCQSQGWTIDDVVGDEDGYQYHTGDDVPVEVGFHPDTVVEIFHDWDAYKQKNGLIEHNDYMVAAANESASLGSDVDVLFIDEFQDLSPLMYYLYQVWADDVERVYMAGDGDQAIMGFRGSTDQYINGTRVDEYVPINQSYRCGQNILDVASTWLEKSGSLEQHPDSTASDGVVRDTFLPQGSKTAFSELVLRQVTEHGEVMILSRTVRGVGYLAHSLREMGIPYSGVHKDGSRLFRWDDPMGQMLDVARAFQHREKVPTKHVWKALQSVPDNLLTQEGRALTGIIPNPDHPVADQYGSALMSFSSILECVTASNAIQMVNSYDLTDWERELLQDAVSAETRVRPTDVRIGTIHSAKGMEAPSVILDTAYTRTLRDEFRRSSTIEAEERRLYYVAATRAKEVLVALHDFRGSVEMPLFADGVEALADGNYVIASE